MRDLWARFHQLWGSLTVWALRDAWGSWHCWVCRELSWLIIGALGTALCKSFMRLTDVSVLVIIVIYISVAFQLGTSRKRFRGKLLETQMGFSLGVCKGLHFL